MNKIDITNWKEFVIGELFSVSRPAARSQVQYLEGDIPFVASGTINNGVVKYCTPKDGELLDQGNCITVSPLDGYAFYQPNNFLGRGGAGSAILILRNDNLNPMNGLFVATAIRASLTKYNYADQLNSETVAQEIVKLPIEEDGSPDWKYMELFMVEVMNKSHIYLNYLKETLNLQ